MRCHQARKRLIELAGNIGSAKENQELNDHINSCDECALFAQAEQTLARDMANQSTEPEETFMALREVRSLVEERLQTTFSTRHKEITIVSKIRKQFSRRPKLGFSLALAVVVLLACTLIPFKYQDTVGYEVAVAGVDKNMALDEAKMTTLLTALGLPLADFVVEGCEATCNIKIGSLKDEGEVKLVIAAFNEIGNCEVGNVETLIELKSGSWVSSFSASDGDLEWVHEDGADGDVQFMVLECLDSLAACDSSLYSIWVTKADNVPVDLDFGNEHIRGSMFIHEDNNQPLVEFINDGDSETMYALVTDADGNINRVNMDDEDAIEQLKAFGLNISAFSENADGNKFMICVTESTNCDTTDEDPNAKDISKPTLPEGMYLQQNYPNPFNPTTEIRFGLPQAQHVSLDIFNIRGQKVKSLVDGVMSTGDHTVEWDATNSAGQRVASGMYFYRLQAGDYVETKKMSLLK